MNQIPNIEETEALSEKIHHLYCAQYEKDHGEPYWTNGDYSKLDERTKEYDRNIARFIHQQLQKAREGAFEEAFSSGHKNGHKDGVKYRSSQMRVFIDKETQDGGLDESWYGAFFAMKRHLESLDHSELDHLPDSPLNQEIE